VDPFEEYEPDEPEEEEEDIPSDDGERERSPSFNERAAPAPLHGRQRAAVSACATGRPIRPMSFEQEIGKASERVASRISTAAMRRIATCTATGPHVRAIAITRAAERSCT